MSRSVSQMSHVTRVTTVARVPRTYADDDGQRVVGTQCGAYSLGWYAHLHVLSCCDVHSWLLTQYGNVVDTARVALRRWLAPDVRQEFCLSNCAENGGSTTDSIPLLMWHARRMDAEHDA